MLDFAIWRSDVAPDPDCIDRALSAAATARAFVTARKRARVQSRGRAGQPAIPVRNPAAADVLQWNSAWLFVVFSLAMLVAFWPTYFSRLSAQPTYHPHAHGLAMAAWCAMLVTQAWLIRTNRRPLHRRIGTLSYALVPLMVITTINFIHFRVRAVQDLGAFGLYFLSLIVNALIAFLVLYGLALYYRRDAAVHARYMVCTIFPLFTPVTDRLIGAHIPSIVPLVPRIDGAPILPVAGFILADVTLLALSIWDWRANRRAVLPIALGVVVLYHVSVLTFYRLPSWAAFGAWFVRQPLS
jgi:hypothetical protein